MKDKWKDLALQNQQRIGELEAENKSLKRLIVKLKRDLERARHVD